MMHWSALVWHPDKPEEKQVAVVASDRDGRLCLTASDQPDLCEEIGPFPDVASAIEAAEYEVWYAFLDLLVCVS